MPPIAVVIAVEMVFDVLLNKKKITDSIVKSHKYCVFRPENGIRGLKNSISESIG